MYPPEARSAFTQNLRDLERCIEPWPAPGNDNGVLVYAHDQESDDFSVGELELLLTSLATTERGARVHRVAADVDSKVFEQRVFSERVMHAARRMVVYPSSMDNALDLADLFFQRRGGWARSTPTNSTRRSCA